MIKQVEISLPQYGKGFHRIEQNILSALDGLPEYGMLNIFIKHTSAALMLNENADPDVLHDLEKLLDKAAPENAPFYFHTLEGSDDMPAHFKSAVIGVSLNIPITDHRFNTGTWQGIYLCEFRRYGGSRKLVLTVYY